MAMEHDPLGTRALAREIREEFGGRPVHSAWLERDRRRGGLRFADGGELLFLLHPTMGYVLAGEDLPRLPSPRSRTFRKAEILDVRAPPDERLLELDLGSPPHPPNWRVVAELLTNQWNLLVLDLPEEEISTVAWPREPGDRVLRPGARYRRPAGEREGAGEPVSEGRWRELLEGPRDGLRGRLLRNVAWTSGVNAAWILEPYAGPDERTGGAGGPAGAASDPAGAAYRRYRSLLDSARGDEPRAWLLPGEDGPLPYVSRLGRDDARPVPSLLAGMARAAAEGGVLDALRSESPLAAGGEGGGEESAGGSGREAPPEPDAGLVELLEALQDAEERLLRRRDALRSELEEGEAPEELRSVGHLLLARKDRVPRGASRAELEDFDGTTREVELDPRLGPAENARRYYDRATRRQRAEERVPEEIRRTEERIGRVSEAREGLREAVRSGQEVEEERREELWALAGGRPGEDGAGDEEARLPYRTLRTAGGLEVRVGRSSKDNDELTFHHSAPDDIWLHARQVPGSHVILRWGHREGNPPRRDLQEAAVAAAANSKARHSGTVGVDWTRRKYVRSPRKSAPGVVVPERVKTVFVKPDQAVVQRMAAREAARGG